MTKEELLENEAFMTAPMDAVIELPNWHYGENGDKREEAPLSEIEYWEFKNQIHLW